MTGHEFIWDGRGNRGEDARYSIISGRAASDPALGALHFRILAHAGRFNQRKGWTRLSQSELAELFAYRRQQVNKAIQELVEWEYLQKRSQEESGESFCLYRPRIDEGNVSEKTDTSQARGVSGKTDTRVSKNRHSCSAKSDTLKRGGIATRARVDQIDHIEHKDGVAAQASLAVSEALSGMRDGLIPFDEPTEGVPDYRGLAELLREAVDAEGNSLASGSNVGQLLKLGELKAAKGKVAQELANEWRLPFTPRTIAAIRMMCVDPETLARRYLEKTKGKTIHKPNAYLFRMAQEVVAEREGMPISAVAKIAAAARQSNNATDREFATARAAALEASELGSETFKRNVAAALQKRAEMIAAGQLRTSQ